MVYTVAVEEHELCTICEKMREQRDAVRELALALAKFQKSAAPVLQSYETTRRSHLQCALCQIMAGKTHLIQELVPEPLIPRARGQKRYDVCTDCYQHLKRVRRSVPEQRNYSKALDVMLATDEEENELDA